jgi:hypothetical protein
VQRIGGQLGGGVEPAGREPAQLLRDRPSTHAGGVLRRRVGAVIGALRRGAAPGGRGEVLSETRLIAWPRDSSPRHNLAGWQQAPVDRGTARSYWTA